MTATAEEMVLRRIEEINSLLEQIVSEVNSNGNRLYSGRLLLQQRKCKPGCRWCPHGPYWVETVYSPKKKKYVFRHIGTTLAGRRLHISGEQKKKLKPYDERVNELRKEKKKLITYYKKMQGEYSPRKRKVCPHCGKPI
jgi:hypothetical protein